MKKYCSMENYKGLCGIVPPMITPMTGEDRLDREGAVRLVRHMTDGGVHGIFILGTTGEAQSLSYKLRYELTETVCAQATIPVLVGITDTSMSESVALARKAKECGAAAVVSAAPYYYAPSQQELIEYYTALADQLPLPLYLYNMPSHVKVILEPATVKTLSEHSNIVGLKDSSANMSYFHQLLFMLGEDPEFRLFVGPEEMTAECVLMGAAGGVNGGANMFPSLYVELYNAAAAMDVPKVRELQLRVMDVAQKIYRVGRYGSSYMKGIKAALSLMGICDDYLAYPSRKFRSEERAKIREALESLAVKIVNP